MGSDGGQMGVSRGSDGVIWGHMGSNGVGWGRMGSDGVRWGQMGSDGVGWGRMESDGVNICTIMVKLSELVQWLSLHYTVSHMSEGWGQRGSL